MPMFEVWCPDYGQDPEDGERLEEMNAHWAAETWAEREDQESAEYRIIGGEEVRIMVRNLENRALYAFDVRGEATPQYHAEDVSDSCHED